MARPSPTGCCPSSPLVGLGRIHAAAAADRGLVCFLALLRRPWSPCSTRPGAACCAAIREDEDAAAALGKNVFSYKLQSLAIAAALAAVAGFFLALNVTYLYPSEFDPTFTFFGYAILVLGGFAQLPGAWRSAASCFWALLEGTRLLDLPLSAEQLARCAS